MNSLHPVLLMMKREVLQLFDWDFKLLIDSSLLCRQSTANTWCSEKLNPCKRIMFLSDISTVLVFLHELKSKLRCRMLPGSCHTSEMTDLSLRPLGTRCWPEISWSTPPMKGAVTWVSCHQGISVLSVTLPYQRFSCFSGRFCDKLLFFFFFRIRRLRFNLAGLLYSFANMCEQGAQHQLFNLLCV